MTRMVQVAAIVAGIIIGVSSPAIRAQGLNGLGGMTDGTHQFKPYRRIHLGPEYRDTIIEAMVYECPFCRALNNQTLRWADTLPSSIHFEQMPAAVGKPWISMAQSYFAVAAIDPGILPRFDSEAFHLVQDDHDAYSDPRTYALATEKIGVRPADYLAAMRYKPVQQLVLQDIRVMGKAGIRQTPSLIICGRYVITPGSVQGNYSLYFQLANALASHCISENHLEDETP